MKPIFRLLITMSASPMARAATSGQDIPTRLASVLPSDWPNHCYTLLIPGIERMLTWEKNQFNVPGITSGLGKTEQSTPEDSGKKSPVSSTAAKTEDDQFSMDIWTMCSNQMLSSSGTNLHRNSVTLIHVQCFVEHWWCWFQISTFYNSCTPCIVFIVPLSYNIAK